MKKTVVVGIDFSKKTLGVSCFKLGSSTNSYYQQFINSENGCLELISWVKKYFNDSSQWLICGEYTGIYSMTAAVVFNDQALSFWLENPKQGLTLRLIQSCPIHKTRCIECYLH